ncbi:alpha/beta fold hydrolase [Nitrospira moscoviensis]|uniref:Putative BioH protein n=1 Tax=Nitrospira moscoviensis TaxID=42253 RepID=A0A0K2GJI3_NITMO|nr:alpha/beta fold hydrolase [Nitrospira moscoviensis]ALA61113.1 putative BioH protein [Nitrospira moscoviensis]
MAAGAPLRQPTALVLLPGLDGTDVFFRPLIAALPDWIEPRVVHFPPEGVNDYPALLSLVRAALADIPYCYVLGSSFAGPLALMAACAEPDKIRGVVLSTTFVTAPRPTYTRLKFAAVTPAIWMLRACRRIPVWLSHGPVDQFRLDKAETWKRVSARMVAARIRTLLEVDARDLLRRCPQPVLCLAGTNDGVVPGRNVDEMKRVRPSVEVRMIEGCHFALYKNAGPAGAIIRRFVADVEARHRQSAGRHAGVHRLVSG